MIDPTLSSLLVQKQGSVGIAKAASGKDDSLVGSNSSSPVLTCYGKERCAT